jgi:hypothetical protein
MRKLQLALFLLTFTFTTVSLAQDARFNDLANLPFQQDYPTDATAQRLKAELLFQQATQVSLWALPAINMWAMKQGSEAKFGAGYNVLPTWKRRMDAKTLVTTPNSDVIYAMGYVDLGQDGPLVIEVPPRQQGILDDFWQRPLDGPTIDGHLSSAMSDSPGRTEGKAENTCCCHPAMPVRCRRAISSIARAPTTSLCSGEPSSAIPTNLLNR